jgi:uncharacterized cupin superfamily protein
MENEKLQTEKGKWTMENGKRNMENGQWRMENGQWRMENGQWKMENEKKEKREWKKGNMEFNRINGKGKWNRADGECLLLQVGELILFTIVNYEITKVTVASQHLRSSNFCSS